MESRLELRHLAPYLPYGLRAINLHGKEVEIIGLSNGNDSVSNHLWVFRENDKTGRHFQGYLYECKPLLHPLSRLTEPVLKDGKRIRDLGSPYDRPGSEYFELVRRVELSEKYNTPTPNEPYQTIVGTIEHWFVEKLLEWHFDVFGLIEKGLAEPIETSKAKGE